jgi:hypothetical protein
VLKRVWREPWVVILAVVVVVVALTFWIKQRQAGRADDEFRPSPSVMKEARRYRP